MTAAPAESAGFAAAACRRILSAAVAILPPPWRRGLARALGWVWFDAIRLRRRIVLENLQRAFPEWTEDRRRAVGRESVQHLCLTAIEALHLPFLNRENCGRRVRIRGWEHCERARAGGKGVLFLALHLGNVETMMAAVSLRGVPLHVIAKRFRNRFFTRLVFDLRRSFGTRFIEPHGRRTAFEIIQACRRNEAVGFVLDQYMRPEYGVETTFFGHRTGTAYGLALFALKTGAPVLPIYSHRDADDILQVVIEDPVPVPAEMDRPLLVQALTQRYNDRIEAIVRRHPEQWMWVHRRWKPFR